MIEEGRWKCYFLVFLSIVRKKIAIGINGDKIKDCTIFVFAIYNKSFRTTCGILKKKQVLLVNKSLP